MHINNKFIHNIHNDKMFLAAFKFSNKNQFITMKSPNFRFLKDF